MFPGFVSIYRDDEEFIHLYFFPGIDKYGKQIYRSLDLSNIEFDYKFSKNTDDNAIDYKFLEKNIVKIKCKLIDSRTGQAVYRTLEI
ncbi:MAG: hypothetical protein J6D03_00610 [Clostridia bacterium]|nr:hypothetical protein [Clostridia bacterium]